MGGGGALGQEALEMAPGDFTALSRTAYPASVEMHAGLGGSLPKRGHYKEARAEFESVLAVAPDHASAKEGMPLIP